MMKISTARKNGSYINDDGIGFREIDYKLAGLLGGNLIIVGGRPGMGKTAFAFTIANNLAISSKKSVMFFSVQLPRRVGFFLQERR
ncbi:DnaB-like helicase C-terminal domain-containing protein [Butyrivibrio sp. NC2002]|uniref:DnaB-like helicase C-terminal domain-containing protein n=1 Tax=Butyrivibrio sp. NC2002 TaxID=1410610 RepID=UPI0005631E90|nr:DnaB-like helicase C-terminal domain-containing protein [Butyrivibrio sp. NC2002]